MIRYDTFGTTLTSSKTYNIQSWSLSAGDLDELANTCLSCPPILLHVFRDVSRFSSESDSGRLSKQQCDYLLSVVWSFDVETWVSSLHKISTSFDAVKRVHVGAAYKAAVSIYVTRATAPTSETILPLESLVSDVLAHLSAIPPDDWFFKATCWPTFIAGAETNNSTRRNAVVERFKLGMVTLPWGYLSDAIALLDRVWAQRNGPGASMDWLAALKSSDTDCLIA